MRRRLFRGTLISLLAASAVVGLVAVAVAAPVPAADAVDCEPPKDAGVAVLGADGRLDAGAELTSLRKTTSLVMQPDGNLVLYAVTTPGGPKHPLWESKTSGNPGAYAVMQADGNFVVYRKGGGPAAGGALWNSQTYGAKNAKLRLTSDGDLSVWGDNGMTVKWSTRTREFSPTRCAPTPAAPNQYMWAGVSWAQSATVWLVFQDDGDLVIYRKRDGKAIWNSGTSGKGAWTLGMEPDGDLGIRPPDGSEWLWHTGTAGNPGAYALLQDDGNFVVYRKGGGPASGGALWATGTFKNI
ncbi:hypothetical protein [Streptomyces celluloflavus]|uniref:hypothetical protein n=1 Tax=Streptomyces celluloflavus TaxID=58344 RepID=UPI0036CDD648